MSEALLRQVLAVSLSVTPVLLILLALRRPLHKRYAARGLCLVWLLLAARLLVPYNPSLPGAPVQLEQPPRSVAQLALTQQDDAGPAPAGGETEAAVVPAAPTGLPAWRLAGYGWLAGAALYLGWQLLVRARLRRCLQKNATPAGEDTQRAVAALCAELGIRTPPRAVLCPALGGPCLTGLVRPVLVLAAQATGPLVLRHELCHLKRRDLWAKRVFLLARALHWFNPLVWLALREAERCIELACDAKTLATASDEQRAGYGQAMLQALRGPLGGALATGFGGSARFMRRRLAGVFDRLPRKRAVAPLALGLALALVLGACVAPVSSAVQENGGGAFLPASSLPTESAPAQSTGRGTVTLEWAGVLYYTDGDRHPYIHWDITNGTGTAITGVTIALAPYDGGGQPLDVYWYSLSDPMTELAFLKEVASEYREEHPLAPGASDDREGGWSMFDRWDGEESEIQHVLACVAAVDFADGTHWENPDYPAWREAHEGRPVDAAALDAYPVGYTIG